MPASRNYAKHLIDMRRLTLALLEGHGRQETAAILGVSTRTVTAIARRSGVHLLDGGNGLRLLGIRLHRAELVRLDALANRAGVSRGELASRLVRLTLAARPEVAARLLGKLGVPRRAYQKRGEAPHAVQE